jgi:hypothetical protein
MLASYSYAAKIFVETGTYLGETVAEMSKHYSQIYTIELSEEYHRKAKVRFAENIGVSCLLGDSAYRLPDVLSEITEPAVFWLDGHYSAGETARSSKYDSPIQLELEAIFANDAKRHIILIDDARLFIGRNSYPKLSELDKFVRRHSRYKLTIRDDIIRLIHDPEWSQ